MIRMLRAALYSRSAQTDARSQSAGRCSADEQTLHSEPDQRLKIGYVPGFADENAYVQRTQDALAHLGQVYPLSPSTRSLWRMLQFRPGFFDVIIVNWLEHKTANPATGKLSLPGIIAYFVQILTFRILARRLIYVRHNIYPHHAESRCAPALTRIIDLSERLYSATATHSGHFPDKHYIPHPLYYEQPMMSKTGKDRHFIVFGRVMPYKNIEQLIDSFPVDQLLIVAGPCDDQEYFKRLQIAAQGKQVEFIPRFLSEEEARELVGTARGLILSHADDDMIVSGSFFYALSLGTPVIGVKTPFFSWVQQALAVQGLTVIEDLQSIEAALQQQNSPPAEAIVCSARQYFSLATVICYWKKLFLQLQVQG
ncbi:glycosyltransferase [Pseudomonas sp. MYb185]|uniref:glycosyltransferase n=1 Tax=Pseudomonas sp. MYb185 TaxID=1848729 RepID=UPI0011B00C0F|nr:glycosyltransferase [Pseudomonas sp. MYb185]